MSLEVAVAGVALIAMITYAVLAGADFGGGVWDLFASGPRRDDQRAAIARAMGPVWEANHVWLVFVIVLLFSGFPLAFNALSIGLFVPFHLVLLGIILRGAAFVFRSYSLRAVSLHTQQAFTRRWGYIFGAASVITPLLLGMCLGAVSSGNLRVINGQVRFEGGIPWLAPISLVIAALALALCAYLAAIYLILETSGVLREDFRRRALYAGTAVVVLAVLMLPLLAVEAPHLLRDLFQPRAWPVLAIGIISALVSGWALWQRRFQLARVSAVIQIVALLGGWGLAQYPYIIYPDITLTNSAAPQGTLAFVMISLPFGLALLIPSLYLLFKVFKAGTLEPERGR